MEGEPLIKSTRFGNTAVKWLLKLWPSVSGSSRAKWSVGCHGSSEADQATQGDGDELGRVHPVQTADTVALGQVETEDEEPQDGGCGINAPQSGSATTCEVGDLNGAGWTGRTVVNAYLEGPARKMPVRHVMRPTEATAIWLSLACCHASLVFSETTSGSSCTRLCSTGTPSLLLLLAWDSLAGLDVSPLLGDVASSGSL